MSKFADIAMGLVIVAGITTIVSHRGSSRVISAAANGFANSIRAATGQAR